MKNLVELSDKAHKNLKVVDSAVIDAIKDQHIINIQLSEACIAATNFPMFFMAVPNMDRWALSAITSLETNKNLFVKDDTWQSAYQPTSMLTYPMMVMPAKDKERQYTIGIDEKSASFSKTEGTELFDEEGKASTYLSGIVKLIEADMQNEIRTIHFCKTLADLSLIAPLNIQVSYENGSANNLGGLHTIDEKVLQSLDVKDLDMLREKGYLAAIYAVLISTYQLNLLLKKHNEVDSYETIQALNTKLNTQDAETETPS